MEFDDVLKNRRSVREYSKKEVDFFEIASICESAVQAPMAGNIYSVRSIIVSDKQKKIKIAEACHDQEFIIDASHIIIVCSDPSQLNRSYEEKGKIFARQQAGAAIENMLLKATNFGLATCWIGAFNENELKRILAVPDNIQIEAVIPVGYQKGAKTITKKKPELKSTIFFEKWGQKVAKPTRKTAT